MIPRQPTQADLDYWSQTGEPCTIGPMRGDHIGAANIQVIRQGNKVRVPWVLDDRDEIQGLREGLTVWTTFWGGMLATDVTLA